MSGGSHSGGSRPARTASRPQGQITRGKTAPNRLRRVDAFLAAYDPVASRGNMPLATGVPQLVLSLLA